jgi:hypothetical protein
MTILTESDPQFARDDSSVERGLSPSFDRERQLRIVEAEKWGLTPLLLLTW